MGSVARRCSATRRERPRPANGGAMATSGSHRAQPFGGRGRCERRRTETRSLGALQEAVARATPRVAGVPLMGGTHRPQGRSMNIKKAPVKWPGLSFPEIDDCFAISSYFVAPQEEHLYPVVTVSSHASRTCTCSS